MIFFCEDCGSRNSLTDQYINKGIITFRCKSCNYLNSYPLPGTTRQFALDSAQTNDSVHQNNNVDSYNNATI